MSHLECHIYIVVLRMSH